MSTTFSVEDMKPYRSCALIIRDKKLLMVTSGAEGKYWTPGGRLEEGETSLQCIQRELREELGVKPERITPAFSCVAYHSEHPTQEKRFDYFLVSYLEGDFTLQEDEITAIKWFSQEELLSSLVPFSTGFQKTALPWLLEHHLI